MTARTLVIIPAFNEEASLPAVLATLRAGVRDCDVLVVDDGSADNTAAVARSGGAMVARLPFNLGVGGALRTGFRFASRHGYERAVQFDADGQHHVAGINALLGELDGGADVVVGSRFVEGIKGYRTGVVRGGAMSVLRFALSLMTGQHFTDTSSGFRAYSRRVIEYFADAYPLEYLSDTVESLLLACYAGFNVVEIPVTMSERTAGVPSNRNLHLVYHYTRLLLVLIAMASLRQRRGARTAP
jgi:glycosyltransferase involved in cell wall biosynthesis